MKLYILKWKDWYYVDSIDGVYYLREEFDKFMSRYESLILDEKDIGKFRFTDKIEEIQFRLLMDSPTTPKDIYDFTITKLRGRDDYMFEVINPENFVGGTIEL